MENSSFMPEFTDYYIKYEGMAMLTFHGGSDQASMQHRGAEQG